VPVLGRLLGGIAAIVESRRLYEEHSDGRYAVFVPSVPTPAAATVCILDRRRSHLVDVPFTKAVSVTSKWGAGSRDLLDAMRPPQV
jgi:uncharacterized membrane protein